MGRYLKKLLYSLKEIFIVYLIEFILLFVLGIFENYNLLYGGLIIYNLLIIIIFHSKIEFSKRRNIFPLIGLGVGFATLFNMLIFLVFNPSSNNNVSLILIILLSGILGPLVEELLFRKILLEKLLLFNNKYLAIILSSLIFSILHGSLITGIYTFIFGIILSFIYLKYHQIIFTMIIHICANMITIFLVEFNLYILILGFILFLLSMIIIINENNYQVIENIK